MQRNVSTLIIPFLVTSLGSLGCGGGDSDADDDAAVSVIADAATSAADAAIPVADAATSADDAAIPVADAAPLPGIMFLTQPQDVVTSTLAAPVGMQDFSIRVLDLAGDPVVGSILLTVENDPAWGVLCNDGRNVSLYDPVADSLTDTGNDSVEWNEPAASASNPSFNLNQTVYFGRNNDEIGLLAHDGTETSLFTSTYANLHTVGAAFFDATGRLIVGEAQFGDTGDNLPLYQIDTATGADTLLGAVTINGDTIGGWTGVSRHPQTGVFYAVVGLDNVGISERRIMELDPVGMTGANLATLAEPSVSDIAFAPNGTLYATTGEDLSDFPDQLWTIDNLATGEMTNVGNCALGNSRDGAGLAIAKALLTTTGGPESLTVTLDANGEATFSGVSIVAAIPANGAGFTLRVTEPGTELTAVSDAFDVTVPAP
ncbi:MAG: hypothetical protein GY811_25690 [Myxococcales bacterium]|nr:hypothetical protein [Myxococcales bacterium]